MTQSNSVGILIFPGFPMACLTSIIEPLRAANEISGETAFSWYLISEEQNAITASAEVNFDPAMTLEEAKGLDYLILLASPTTEFKISSSSATLRSLHRHGTTLGAVSGGVFPLARAGIGQSAALSVHWCYRSAFEVEFPKLEASDQVLEIGSRLVTASGAAAAFDLALHMIETRLSPAIATEVACWFQHPMMRREGVQQAVPNLEFTGSGDQLPPLVAQAAEIFAQNLSEPVSIADVADDLDVSSRQVERSFKQATGLSPSHYYRKLRMEAARQMVLYTNESLSEVASTVGYGRLHVFAKHYEDQFGLTPTADRKRINLYRVEGNRPVPSL